MYDLGLYGVEICRGQRYRYQTPLNLLIYRSPFGNYERVTDSIRRHESTNSREVDFLQVLRNYDLGTDHLFQFAFQAFLGLQFSMNQKNP